MVACSALFVALASATCSFPEREFNDDKYNRLNTLFDTGGAAGLGGVAGEGGAGTSGAGTGGKAQGGDGGAGQSQGGAGMGGAGQSQGGAGTGGDAQGGAGQGGAGQSQGGAGQSQGGAGQSGAGGKGGAGAAGMPCVDMGKTATCGVGECKREVKVCDGGFTQECVPGAPAVLDFCGDGLDNNCNGKADESCNGNCGHDLCTSAGKLDKACDPCVGAICDTSKFSKCCQGGWGPDCIQAVIVVCGVAQCAGLCNHGLCEAGAALTAGCDVTATLGSSCVAQICADTPACCTDAWTPDCVAKVNSICQLGCSF
jgi:hypothetical protein